MNKMHSKLKLLQQQQSDLARWVVVIDHLPNFNGEKFLEVQIRTIQLITFIKYTI